MGEGSHPNVQSKSMDRLFLHNDDIRDTRERSTSAGQVGLLNGWGVFSTIRVARGVLFAFERHWTRMQRDAALMHVPFPTDSDWLHGRLLRLVQANKAAEATLRVAIVRNHGGPYEGPGLDRAFDLIAFTTGLTEWPQSVSLALKPQGRHAACEFAGAKILSWAHNLTWNEQAHERGFDEVVLLNERGEVSECTSANIFVILGDQVWTPPLSSGCLPGVTRAILLEEVRVAGLQISEKLLMPSDLERADGVFITSTTRDALAVRSIENLAVRSGAGEVLRGIQQSIADWRETYIRNARVRASVSEVVSV